GDIHARHHHLAVGEVDDPDHPEDHGEPERHQAVNRARQQAGDEDVELEHQMRGTTLTRPRSGGGRDPLRSQREGEGCLISDYARLSQPGIGNTGGAAAFAVGSTTVGLPLRFCTAAERRSTFWPFSLNLMAPPIITRSVMFVALSASTSASGLVEPARLAA